MSDYIAINPDGAPDPKDFYIEPKQKRTPRETTPKQGGDNGANKEPAGAKSPEVKGTPGNSKEPRHHREHRGFEESEGAKKEGSASKSTGGGVFAHAFLDFFPDVKQKQKEFWLHLQHQKMLRQLLGDSIEGKTPQDYQLEQLENSLLNYLKSEEQWSLEAQVDEAFDSMNMDANTDSLILERLSEQARRDLFERELSNHLSRSGRYPEIKLWSMPKPVKKFDIPGGK